MTHYRMWPNQPPHVKSFPFAGRVKKAPTPQKKNKKRGVKNIKVIYRLSAEELLIASSAEIEDMKEGKCNQSAKNIK